MSLVALLYSSFFVNEVLSFIADQKKKKKLITSLSSTIIYSYKKIKNRLKEGSRLSEGYLSYNSTFVEYTDYNFGGFLITNLVSR